MDTKNYLSLPIEEKVKGVFVKGDSQNGILKQWWYDGILIYHSIYKDGICKVVLDIRNKFWVSSGVILRGTILGVSSSGIIPKNQVTFNYTNNSLYNGPSNIQQPKSKKSLKERLKKFKLI